jgi:hypothetical protein
MTSRNLIRFTLLTVVSIAVWMLANFRMREDSELRSTLLHVVYPVAVLAGAAALTGLAQRTRPLLSRTGAVSVLRFGGAAGLVIVACVVGSYSVTAFSSCSAGTLRSRRLWLLSSFCC